MLTRMRYAGACHCGSIRFEVETDIPFVTECTCSICAMKGLLHLLVAPENFHLLSPKDQITTYQFGTRTAKHHFCPVCGVQPFTRPRALPEMYTVNVRCLDNFDLQSVKGITRTFDGKNWDSAVAAARRGR
jgi:hypothetical protein